MPGMTMLPACAICCGELNVGHIGTLIPCGHVFHEACFARWETTQKLLRHANDDDDDEEEEDVPADERTVTCPMCMQGVSRFQRIFLDIGSGSAAKETEFDRMSRTCPPMLDTIIEQDESGLVEDFYKSLYERTKREMKKLTEEFRAMEGRYEEGIINQSRSHQETLDACIEKLEKEREKKERYKKELKNLQQEQKKDLKRWQEQLEGKDGETQKWRRLSLEKSYTIARLQQQIQERDERIQKLIGNPLVGSTSMSELIIKLNRHRDVSFPHHNETKGC